MEFCLCTTQLLQISHSTIFSRSQKSYLCSENRTSWIFRLFFENAHNWNPHHWNPQEPRTRCSHDYERMQMECLVRVLPQYWKVLASADHWFWPKTFDFCRVKPSVGVSSLSSFREDFNTLWLIGQYYGDPNTIA